MPQFFDQDDERAPNKRPVSAIAPQYMTVTTQAGSGLLPLYATGAWDAPQSNVTRAVVLLHGRLRNADAYFNLGHRARAEAGRDALDTVLIVPQFLASADVEAHRLPPSTLHWDWVGWMGGDNAVGPAAISSFDALDAILQALASRERFPALSSVVIAGHSGGAQVAQRYAVVTRGEAPLVERGIAVRYVVANPSSYVYFDEQRPCISGDFAALDEASCPQFNRWKYGLDDLPAYVRAGNGEHSAATLESAYTRREVVMLLGAEDCDPLHPALDTSCAARAQGEHRLGRGRAYMRYMRSRHPDVQHRAFEIAGVGHDGAGMFASAPGVAALFGADYAAPAAPPAPAAPVEREISAEKTGSQSKI